MCVMSLTFGCPTLIVTSEFFHPISGVDECFTSIKRLENLIDGAFVYRRVALVSACLSCNEC